MQVSHGQIPENKNKSHLLHILHVESCRRSLLCSCCYSHGRPHWACHRGQVSACSCLYEEARNECALQHGCSWRSQCTYVSRERCQWYVFNTNSGLLKSVGIHWPIRPWSVTTTSCWLRTSESTISLWVPPLHTTSPDFKECIDQKSHCATLPFLSS